jgi:hypothetical protein
MNFALIAANVSDNDSRILHKLFNGLSGKCYGDKGYLILCSWSSNCHETEKKHEKQIDAGY